MGVINNKYTVSCMWTIIHYYNKRERERKQGGERERGRERENERETHTERSRAYFMPVSPRAPRVSS
jgi:hypothetical protein